MTTLRSPAQVLPLAFPGITPDEVEELISNGQIKKHPTSTVLCQENALEDTFYVILEGEVEVTKVINKLEERLLKVLGPGDFFGEMALIHNAPRAATVKALSPLTVLEIVREAFERVLERSNSVSLAMVREISNRLRQNDQMAIEDLRLRAGELAEAYQKLAEQELARRQFLSNVAHELRTPLMAASGFLLLIQKGALHDKQLALAMDKIERNIQQIVNLVNDILFLQEIDLVLPEFHSVAITEIVRSVIERYQQKAITQGITLKLKKDGKIPHIIGDDKSIEHALAALVDNAIKFSPHGGRVEVNLKVKGDKVHVAVRDQGIGISAENLPRIFDRFYHLEKSADKLFGGLGLGLAITKQVIEQHNGKLDVESTLGKGSTFTILLHTWKEGASKK